MYIIIMLSRKYALTIMINERHVNKMLKITKCILESHAQLHVKREELHVCHGRNAWSASAML